MIDPQKRLAIFVSSMYGGGAQRQMLNLAGARIVNIFSRRWDDLLIGYFLGPTELGYYVIVYRLVLVMTRLFGGVTHAVVLPMFSRLQNDVLRYRTDTQDAGQGPMVILGTCGLAHAPIWVQAGEEIMTLPMESTNVWNMR